MVENIVIGGYYNCRILGQGMTVCDKVWQEIYFFYHTQ